MSEVVLQDLMSICVDGPSLEDFDATESCRLCASINTCTIGNCLRLYCRWSYMMSICVDGPALEGFDATQSINVWLSDSELPSMHVTLTLLFEILTFLF